MRNMVIRAIRAVLTVDWREFEGLGALRCTFGVGFPLLAGIALNQPLVGVFGAVGAVGVGFGSFHGGYRGRADVMLLATSGMAFSVLVGSLTGHSTGASVGAAILWAFTGGLLVALGQGASIVGLQSIVALLIAGGFPSNLEEALGHAALALGGGLVQTLLVILIWPLRPFAVERRGVARVYRSLADYASMIGAPEVLPPEPHTFAGTPSPLGDPQPFARSNHVFVFQALLDEAERIRASLAALAIQHLHLREEDQGGLAAVAELSAHALTEIAHAVEEGREPREPPVLAQASAPRGGRPPSGMPAQLLVTQIRAAWRTAGVLPSLPGYLTPRPGSRSPRRRGLVMRDALVTLRANLTMRSTAFRHALRLATILTIAAAGARLFELPRGYWMPLTIALVLKPDFHDTFAFSIARVTGTIVGAAGATALAVAFSPGPIGLNVLVLSFVWAAYAFGTANYALFSICITGYVVFLMALAGIPELEAAADRTIYTAVAGALALCAYIVWPTWSATEARPAIAAMLETQGRYIGSLLAAYANPPQVSLKKLDELRASARLARSNAEAVIERMLSEPPSIDSMKPGTAAGIVGAARRNALAALSLHAGLEGGVPGPVPGIQDLASEVAASLMTLSMAVRRRSAPSPLPRARGTQSVPGAALPDFVRDEADLIVSSVETIRDLIGKDATEFEPIDRNREPQ